MSNNKQSSVEWLWDKFVNSYIKVSDIVRFLEQAEAMHKEEIEKAFKKGVKIGVDVGSNHDYHEGYNAEQYYNETFGGNNENN